MFWLKTWMFSSKKNKQVRDRRTIWQSKYQNGPWIPGKDYQHARSTESILDNYSQYLDFEDIEEWLHYITERYPTMTKLEVIGKSVEERNLYGLTISEGDAETNGRESVFIGSKSDEAFFYDISRMWNSCSRMDLSSSLSIFHLSAACSIRRVSTRGLWSSAKNKVNIVNNLIKQMISNQITRCHIQNQILFR